MSDRKPQRQADFRLPDPAVLLSNMAKAMERSAAIAKLLSQNPVTLPTPGLETNAFEQMGKTFGEIAKAYLNNPRALIEAQLDLWQGHARLWERALRRFRGERVEPAIAPDRNDRRFKDLDWEENQLFDFLKQSYLVSARWAHGVVANAEGVDEHTRHKARFFVEQVANALSPTNFALTNPEVLRLTLASNGENLVEGLDNLAEDIAMSDGELRIRQTDLDAFEVGRNIAVTPGKVVFQNDLMQLIQYEPTMEKVYERPVVIVPPWINKYYILDLNPQKSFIRWAVAQGLTVFVVSWVNPDERLAMTSFADYMYEGVLASLAAIEQATGTREVNAIGYCIGGTLLGATLAYMAAKGDERITSATFFTAQVDFEHAGDIMVFIDEEQLSDIERHMARKGYFEARNMAKAFNLLRSNDLIWSYVVNNYLKGKDPLPFDLLYWNADSTRMPAATQSFYLRECYHRNSLARREMVLDGMRLDLKKVKLPAYNLAAREDHIAPLPSVFKVGQNLGGETRLVVAGSGHIAGVVNPPETRKYQYWTNDRPASTPEEWLRGATEHPGSWWPDWGAWIARHSGKKVKPRVPGDGGLGVIEAAPGSYVRMKAD